MFSFCWPTNVHEGSYLYIYRDFQDSLTNSPGAVVRSTYVYRSSLCARLGPWKDRDSEQQTCSQHTIGCTLRYTRTLRNHEQEFPGLFHTTFEHHVPWLHALVVRQQLVFFKLISRCPQDEDMLLHCIQKYEMGIIKCYLQCRWLLLKQFYSVVHNWLVAIHKWVRGVSRSWIQLLRTCAHIAPLTEMSRNADSDM